MSVRTDTINLIVNVNGNKGQNELNNLRKRAADLKFEMQGLEKGTAEYIAKSKELTLVNSQMASLKKEIGLTSLTQKELIRELNNLKALRGSVTPFSQEYKELSKNIKEVENRLYDVKNGVQGFSSFFSKIKDEVKQFGVVAAGYLGFQFITTQFSNIIRGSGKLSDQLADLRRVAGLTAEEANHLNTQFKELNTRTSTEGLREIAIVAGKLGVAKEDIFEFTKSVDQLVVTLGDELGNADEITTQLGKILNVFDGEINGDNIKKLGNQIVELANTGSATGGFIADFDQRLSGIAKSSGISLGALSGLGAGLEEMGARVESSSTAIQKLIINIATDIPAAAKIAGQSTQDFEKLFKLDPTEALLKYSEGLVKNKQSFSEVTASLKDAGEEGARTIEVISKLGTGADTLRKRIDLGKTSILETAAITEAFALKNETFGATLDKLGKEFNKLVTSPGVTNFLQGAVEGALSFINVLKEVPKFINDNSTALKLLVAGIILLNFQYVKSAYFIAMDSAAKVYNAVTTRATAIANGIAEVAAASYIVVTSLLTGRITLATAAQRLWNIAISIGLGPLGILISVVGVLAIGIGTLIGKTKELSIEQKAQATLAEKSAEIYGDQVNKLELLKKIITSTTSSLAEKKKAYEELIKLNPDFVNTLSLDEQGHLKGADAIDKYIASLKRKGEQQAAQELSNDEFKKQLQTEKKVTDIKNTTTDDSFSFSEFFNMQTDEEAKQEALEKANKDLETIKKTKAFYDNKIEQGIKEDAAADRTTTTPPSRTAASVQNNLKFLKDQLKKLEEAYELIDLADKKGLQKNRQSRQALQDQIDALEGKKTKSERKDDNDYARLKKEAEKFYQDILKLKKNAELKGEEPEQAELDRVREKYAELTAKAKEYFAKQITNKRVYNEEEKLLEEAKQAELNAIFQKYFKKRLEEDGLEEYEKSLEFRKEYSNKLKVLAAQDYADGKLKKGEYEAEIKKIDKDETADRIVIAQDYSAIVKKAAKDVTNFRKQQEKETTDDLIKNAEARAELSEKEILSKANRAVLTSRPGSIENRDARKNQLKLQNEKEIQDLKDQYKAKGVIIDDNNEIIKEKQAELNKSLQDLDKEYWLGAIDNVMNYVSIFSDALSNLNQFLTNRENRLLQQDKAANDKKKKEYKTQLDTKLISKEQYDKKVQKIDEEQEKKEREVRRKQAAREKALNLFNAITSNAAAIIKTMSSVPYPFNIPLAIAQGIAGGLQIAAIANTPLPELGKGDWVRKGDKHKDASGGIPVFIERDEAVIKADAMTDPTVRTVTGTTAQITSALNSQAGGVNWAGGALIELAKWRSERPATINPNMHRIMAEGGIVRQMDSSPAQTDPETKALIIQMTNEMSGMREDMSTWQKQLHVVMSIKEFRKKEADYNSARKVSGINHK